MTSELIYQKVYEVLLGAEKPLSAGDIAKRMTTYRLDAKSAGGIAGGLVRDGKVRRIVTHPRCNKYEVI